VNQLLRLFQQPAKGITEKEHVDECRDFTAAPLVRYELADHEWAAIKPMPPNKPSGVARVNDSRVLKGIFVVDLSLESCYSSN
jgi:hypothetical protein